MGLCYLLPADSDKADAALIATLGFSLQKARGSGSLRHAQHCAHHHNILCAYPGVASLLAIMISVRVQV